MSEPSRIDERILGVTFHEFVETVVFGCLPLGMLFGYLYGPMIAALIEMYFRWRVW